MKAGPAAAGRQAGYLFAIGGVRALIAPFAGAHHPGLAAVVLGIAELAVATVALVVPWRRLPWWSTLALALTGFGVIAALEGMDLIPVRANGVPFVIVFAWAGAHHPRWTSWALLGPAGLAYSAPPAVVGSGFDPRALVLTLGGCLLVAEVVGHATGSASEARARAERASASFRVVAEASAQLHRLDPLAVLDAVADAVIDLGFEGATLALIEADAGVFRCAHTRGVLDGVSGTVFPASEGLTAQVRATAQTMVVEDYQSAPTALEAVRACGIRCVVAVPVVCDGSVMAVLYAASRQSRAAHSEDVEAMRMLASTAGLALDNARKFTAQRDTARHHATVALTDQLTGLGNRRYAEQELARLTPADTLVLIDLDHFKDVNDKLGHAAGDRLLRSVAAHLVNGVRENDHVTRYGGEEFLLLLPDLDALRAERLVQRLLVSWRETQPDTTFSVGIAQHTAGQPETTVELADQALYAAKAAGRDTYRTASHPHLRSVPAQPVRRHQPSPGQPQPVPGQQLH